MKMLIAHEPGSEAEMLTGDLRRAGLPTEVEALVLSVADVLLPPVSTDAAPPPSAVVRARQHAEQALAQAQAAADAEGARLAAAFPTWRIRTEARADSPAWAIVQVAEAWNPDLIVVGSREHSMLGRLMLGSVAHRVLTEAQCSVRIVRAVHAAPAAPARLLLGIDGSAGANAAMHSVARRIWPPASEARLVAVADATLTGSLSTTASSSDEHAAIDHLVNAAESVLGSAGLLTSRVVTPGDPKRVLVNEAEQWNADCIFLGARGLRGFDRFFLGSVSAAVAARARCSVEVVRSAAH